MEISNSGGLSIERIKAYSKSFNMTVNCAADSRCVTVLVQQDSRRAQLAKTLLLLQMTRARKSFVLSSGRLAQRCTIDMADPSLLHPAISLASAASQLRPVLFSEYYSKYPHLHHFLPIVALNQNPEDYKLRYTDKDFYSEEPRLERCSREMMHQLLD